MILTNENEAFKQQIEALTDELAEVQKQLDMSEDLRERINRDLDDEKMRLQEGSFLFTALSIYLLSIRFILQSW